MDNTAAPILVRAVRSRRGRRGLFDDEIYRRPRHLDRRPRRRRRQLRLGGASGAPAGAEHARSQLPRRGLDPGGEAAGSDRLHPEDARDVAARPRRGDGPFNAFLFLQGVETLALRMREHCDNARGWPIPGRAAGGRAGDPSGAPHRVPAQRTEKYLRRPGRPGRLRAGRWGEAGRRFINALQLFYHVANIGDARSLAIHPASTTHSQFIAEEQAATGVTTAMCGCRSGWSTSTTSWPTSVVAWKPRASSPRRRS